MIRIIAVYLTLVSTAFSFTSYREEVRSLTLKNHDTSSSYSAARKFLFTVIHLEQDKDGYFVYDVYCGKKFRNNVGPRSMPSSTIVNTEHTWPRSKMHSRGSHQFKIEEADLHHLYPTDSKANSVRGNNRFSEFDGTGVGSRKPAHGNCNLSHSGKKRNGSKTVFEPPHFQKGNVARALFYFSVRYNMPISDEEEFFLRIWNKLDPVDDMERRRNDYIEQYQGNRNPFIDDSDYADLIENF